MRFRVATVNAQHARSWTRRVDIDQLAAGVRALDADVVGYQEIDKRTPRVRRAHLPAALASATGHTVSFGSAVRLGPWGRYGIAVGIRATGWHAWTVALPTRRGLEPRVAVLANPIVGSIPVVVTVAHLSPDDELAPLQLAEVERLTRAAGPGPHVLLADVNMRESQWRPQLAEWGFDAATTAPTFPSWRPRHRIDIVAVRGGTIVAASTRRLPVSDHRALLADIEVP